MLTSERTVHMLICMVRGYVCCPLIQDSSFIHFVCYTQPNPPPPPTPPISNCFHFLLGITVCTRETENNTCAKGFGGSCIISISKVLLLYFGSTGTYPPVRYANYTAPLYDGVYFIPVQNGNIKVLLPFLPP